MNGVFDTGIDEHDIGEVHPRRAWDRDRGRARDRPHRRAGRAARGDRRARSPGVAVDYRALEPLGPDELADVLAGRDLDYRQRIVHHMVLGELVLRPIPVVVAHRVAKYAEALGVKDDFVRVARRYAQGAYGLAWMDLQRSGFVEHVREAGRRRRRPGARDAAPFEPAEVDPELAARWTAFAELPPDSLGRLGVGDVRQPRLRAARHARRRARLPRAARLRARARRLRHEPQGRARGLRVHRSRRSRPEGLRVAGDARSGCSRRATSRRTGFFDRDVRERRDPGARHAPAASPTPSGAGKVVCNATATTCSTSTTTSSRRGPSTRCASMLGVPPKSARRARRRIGRRSSTLEGMSETQRQGVHANAGEAPREPELHARRSRCAAPTPSDRIVEMLAEWDLDQADDRHHGLHGHCASSPTATTPVAT